MRKVWVRVRRSPHLLTWAALSGADGGVCRVLGRVQGVKGRAVILPCDPPRGTTRCTAQSSP